MPEMDGIAATKAIRIFEQEEERETRTPIMALTANAMKGDRERIISAGMDDYLTKPVVSSMLFEKIRELTAPESVG